MYFEVAVLTESEFVAIIGLHPKDLKVSSVSLTNEEGGQMSGYLVSLKDMPSSELPSIRKLRMSRDVTVSCTAKIALAKEVLHFHLAGWRLRVLSCILQTDIHTYTYVRTYVHTHIRTCVHTLYLHVCTHAQYVSFVISISYSKL